MLLIIGLIIYTFITMLGGNPLGDRFGFRYWRDPGSFAELYYTGNLGRFLGFLQCLIQASFTVAGPDYVSMAAGEAENPRKVMPKAYNAVFYRLTAFFVLGSLAVGINVPYNDQELQAAFKQGLPGAAASPYVVAMNRLRIRVLPDIVNAMVLASAFSAGNSYVYCASRSLFGLALEGKAPKILTRCTRNGVPIYCVAVTLAISLLSFLQVSTSAAVVLQWFVNLVSHMSGVRDWGQVAIALLTKKTGYCFPTHQLLRHVLHFHPIHESLRGTRTGSQYSPAQRLGSAICGLVCPNWMLCHDFCGRLHGVSAGSMGCPDVPLLVHDDRSIPGPFCWMEDTQTDEVAEAE